MSDSKTTGGCPLARRPAYRGDVWDRDRNPAVDGPTTRPTAIGTAGVTWENESVDLLDRIDDLTAPTGKCRVCEKPLGEDSVSDDFCCEFHQDLWRSGGPIRRLRDGRVISYTYALVLIQGGRADLLAPETRDDIAREMTEVMRPAVEVLAQIAEGVRRAFADVTATMKPLVDAARQREGRAPTAPADPKARALHLVKHRNTGPQVHADPRRNR